MLIALYSSNMDNDPVRHEGTWDDLVSMLGHSDETDCHPCAGSDCAFKMGAAWSPVELFERCQRGSKCTSKIHETDPNHSALRHNDNVKTITVAVFDLDHLTASEVAALPDKVDGYRCLIHSTHNHKPEDDDHCYRLVMALSEPVPAHLWNSFLPKVVRSFGFNVDEHCKDLSRLYFLPTHKLGNSPYFESVDGNPIDVRAFLSDLTAKPAAASAPVTPRTAPAQGDASEGFDLVPLYKRLREVLGNYRRSGDTERGLLLERVLDGKPFAVPGRVKPEDNPQRLPVGRDPFIHKAASILATSLPAHTPPEVAVEIMRGSIAAMDCEPEGLDRWLEKVNFSFGRRMAERIETDAIVKAKNEELKNRLKGLARDYSGNRGNGSGQGVGIALHLDGSSETLSPEGGSVGAPETASGEQPEEEWQPPSVSDEELAANPDAWLRLLIEKPANPKQPDAENALLSCTHNVKVILTYHFAWKGVLRWNDVSKKVEVHGGPLAADERHESVLPVAISNWLLVCFEMRISESEIKSTILLVARTNTYNPVQDYLLSVTWDGVNRIDTFLASYCNALTTDPMGEDITAHVNRISRRWLVAAAARALEPGCKVDNVLIIEGAQGEFKSSTFDALAGSWFTDSPVALGDKDSRLIAGCNWIVEIAELSSFKKSETENLKAFFSQRIDKFRPPYGASPETSPRRCVFVGTTNDEAYLKDGTGNRRYWPVRCGSTIDLGRIQADRDQIWAEAVAVYVAGLTCTECPKYPGINRRCPEHRWWLDKAETAIAESQTASRMDRSVATLTAIAQWWYEKAPKSRPTFLITSEVGIEALRLPVEKASNPSQLRSVEMDVGTALRELGFIRKQQRIYGVKTWGYIPTEELRDHPQVPRNRAFAMIAQAKATQPPASAT